jgi:hypothetical protein
VTALRTLLDEARGERRNVEVLDEDVVLGAPSGGADPEIEHLKRVYKKEVGAAFEEATAALAPEDRNVLRSYYGRSMTIDEIAAAFGIHRAAAARRVNGARDRLLAETRRRIAEAGTQEPRSRQRLSPHREPPAPQRQAAGGSDVTARAKRAVVLGALAASPPALPHTAGRRGAAGAVRAPAGRGGGAGTGAGGAERRDGRERCDRRERLTGRRHDGASGAGGGATGGGAATGASGDAGSAGGGGGTTGAAARLEARGSGDAAGAGTAAVRAAVPAAMFYG